jgi:hypothetical protein
VIDTGGVRWLVPIVVLATACYRPGDDPLCALTCNTDTECPSGLTCSLGRCGPSEGCGAILDAPVGGDATDAVPPLPPCLPPNPATSFTSLTGTISGYSYTMSSAGDGIAVYQLQEFQGEMRLTKPKIDVTGTAITFFGSTAIETYARPRLAPNTTELFMLATTAGTPDTHRFVRAEQMTGVNWGAPIGIAANGALVDNLFVPGVPSMTNPRRMIVETRLGLYEGIEQTPGGDWDFAELDFERGGLAVKYPAISPDGLSMVFVGTPLGGATTVYLARRPDVTVGFVNPTLIYDDLDSGVGIALTPALSPDCATLFLTRESPRRVLFAN